MMKLAVNYSPQAAQLYSKQTVQFDLFKCRSNPALIDMARFHRPAYVHLPLRAGRGNLAATDWDFIERVLAWTDTRFINLYLAPYAPDFPEMHMESTELCWRERLTDLMIEDVMVAVKRFGADRILLENAPWDITPGFSVPRLSILPEVISDVIKATDTGLILDVAHARIAAKYLEMSAESYMQALPVNRLSELHVTGIAYDEHIPAWQDHYAMTEEDWALVNWIFDRIGAGEWHMPEIVALEYGGVTPRLEWRSDPLVMQQDIPRLQALMGKTQQMANRLPA